VVLVVVRAPVSLSADEIVRRVIADSASGARLFRLIESWATPVEVDESAAGQVTNIVRAVLVPSDTAPSKAGSGYVLVVGISMPAAALCIVFVAYRFYCRLRPRRKAAAGAGEKELASAPACTVCVGVDGARVVAATHGAARVVPSRVVVPSPPRALTEAASPGCAAGHARASPRADPQTPPESTTGSDAGSRDEWRHKEMPPSLRRAAEGATEMANESFAVAAVSHSAGLFEVMLTEAEGHCGAASFAGGCRPCIAQERSPTAAAPADWSQRQRELGELERLIDTAISNAVGSRGEAEVGRFSLEHMSARRGGAFRGDRLAEVNGIHYL